MMECKYFTVVVMLLEQSSPLYGPRQISHAVSCLHTSTYLFSLDRPIEAVESIADTTQVKCT